MSEDARAMYRSFSPEELEVLRAEAQDDSPAVSDPLTWVQRVRQELENAKKEQGE